MKLSTNYKILLIPAIILLIFSLGVIAINYASTGTIVDMGIDFKGGSHINIEIDTVDQNIIKQISDNFKEIDNKVVVRTSSGIGQSIIIETEKNIEMQKIKELLSTSGLNVTNEMISIQFVGAALGSQFFKEAISAVIIALLLMALVIFLTFKTIVPSFAIIQAAIVDIIFAIAMMNIFGIELSMASLAALLMLLGYSVDTDVLLTTRLIKRTDEGTLDERINASMKTGITMTTAAIVAFVVLYIFSTSQILDEISIVIIFGLLADYISTWFGNVGILRWYIEKDNKKDDVGEKIKEIQPIKKNIKQQTKNKRKTLRKKKGKNR
ncbi:MAG: protein translocase subunit SecF [DPANN group archaeon]|nr:protein translocase subunit SecF [DPANN group archaeon]